MKHDHRNLRRLRELREERRKLLVKIRAVEDELAALRAAHGIKTPEE